MKKFLCTDSTLESENPIFFPLTNQRQTLNFKITIFFPRLTSFLYAKMLHKEKIVLVETYRDEQLLYPMRFENGVFGPSNLVWKNVQSQLEQVVLNLNRIEEDEEFRQKIINILF